MWETIGAIWLAAGAVSVAGTLWLMVASKLRLWPFRTELIPDLLVDIDLVPAVLSEGEFWFDVPGSGLVHGHGTLEQAFRFRDSFYDDAPPPGQESASLWFNGAKK
jgi:hypothetical protein